MNTRYVFVEILICPGCGHDSFHCEQLFSTDQYRGVCLGCGMEFVATPFGRYMSSTARNPKGVRVSVEGKWRIEISNRIGALRWIKIMGSAITLDGFEDINQRIRDRWDAYQVTEAMKEAG